MAQRDQPTLFNTVDVVVACLPRLGWQNRLWLAGRLLLHTAWLLVWWGGSGMVALLAAVLAAALWGAVGFHGGTVGMLIQGFAAAMAGLWALLWMVSHGHKRAERWRSRLVMGLRMRMEGSARVSSGGRHGSVAVGARMPAVGLLAYPPHHGHSSWAAVAVVLGVLVCALSVGVVHAQNRFHCRAKVSEAKTALKAIYVTELTSRDEFGTWLPLDALVEKGGLDPKTLANLRYYNVTGTADARGFRFEAVDTRHRLVDGKQDRWVITQDGPAPRQLEDACR